MRVNPKAAVIGWSMIVIFAVSVFAQEKPCPTASKFGPDDQIGNLNYITPAKTLAGC